MPSFVDKHGNLAFFGRLSWGNFVDWLVTLCLASIIILTTVFLGGVRPDTHLTLLPLFVILLVLHGIWLAVDDESPKRLSHIPLFFVPAIIWMFCSLIWISPMPWRGWYEMIYILQVFIFLWVLSNNVRSRAHLWLLIILSLVPAVVAIFNGFYQFFQEPEHMVGAMTPFRLELNSEFLGRATGVFADPNSFAAFLLILLPSLLIAAAVKRLPKILRLLFLYVAIMFIAGIVFTQSYWATVLVVILVAGVPWFCFRTIKKRILFSFVGVFVATVIFVAMLAYHPLFKRGIERALSEEGEGIRRVLWSEALTMASEHPITGVGAGAYGAAFEQSPRVALADVPVTPHNDYLLVLSQLGLIGIFLFGAPSLYVFFKALGRWRKEPFAVKLRSSEGTIMPPQRLFLSLGLTGTLAFALSLSATFVFYVPALMLYGTLAFTILVKTSFNRRLKIPEHLVLRVAYLLLSSCVGGSFYVLSSTKIEAQALELRGRQQLQHIVNMRTHVSGNVTLLDEVILLYQDAVIADPNNADAWIGLSASVCQLYFRSPAEFKNIAGRAVTCGERAVELSPRYWKAWAQLGVAHSFYGEAALAEKALLQALDFAPNSSNAHYYYAAFLSADRAQRDEALSFVERALEINPRNSAARRLQQKLLIF